MQSPKLSILIPSTFDRREMTDNLVEHLGKMHNSKDVEIHTYYDNKEMSVGKKRQKMLETASGEYVVFIDSDDWVPEYYIDEMMKAIEKNPCCIGMEMEVRGVRSRKPVETASMSKRWRVWRARKGGFDYVRPILHLNPIKREIALQIGYKDMRFTEDHDYSTRLMKSGLLKMEVYIPKLMYIYRYKNEPHEEKYHASKKALCFCYKECKQ